MINGYRVLAIIPARKGSKGIPGKNIKIMNGKPLIVWTIEQAKKSRYIDKILVSTDCNEIKKISEKAGAKVPYIRPKELSGDKAKTVDVASHAVEYLEKNEKEKYEIMLLLEPTSPLRAEEDIDNAIEKIISNDNIEAVISIGKMSDHPVLAKRIDGESIKPYFGVNDIESRRQDLTEAYFPYGVVYAIKTKVFEQKKTFYPENQSYIELEDWQCFELDKRWDWVCIEAIMEKMY